MEIYCDESGYTGKNLLSEDQPYFVYSAVNLIEDEINDIFQIISNEYDLQGGELKGNKVVKSPRGKKAILRVFQLYAEKVKLVFHDKKYALAGKIVEAGVEPYLKSNHYFYQSKLNTFITSGLYTLFVTKEESAEKLLYEFELLSKGKIEFKDTSIKKDRSENALVYWLTELISTNPNIFEYEIKGGELNNRLTLDLTITSLMGLLSEWGKAKTEMKVICDNSKVFLENPVFDLIQNLGSHGNRTKILNTEIGYKLISKIEHHDSKDFLGLQIADLFSSVVFHCLKTPNEAFSKEIMKLVYNHCICKPASFCLLPEINHEELLKNADNHFDFMNYILWDAYRDPKTFDRTSD